MELTTPRLNRSLALAGIACAVASLYCGLHAAINDDDVYHLHSIWLVAHGEVPYREFFEIHPPGMWLLLSPFALLFATPSFYLLSARALTAALFGTVVLLAARCIRARGAAIAFLAVLALGIMAYCMIWIFRAEYIAAALLMVHLTLLAGLEAARRKYASVVIAAAALALASTMSVRVIPFLAIEPLFILLRVEARSWLRLLIAWAAGLLLGALPTIIYLSFHGLWGDMTFWAFRFVASSDVVWWGFRMGPAEVTLICLGAAAIALSYRTDAIPAASRMATILAWLISVAFHLTNPHKIDYAAIYLLLTTAMLLSAIVPLVSMRFGVVRRDGALITAAVGLVFYLRLIPGTPVPFDRTVQQMQLRVLDWLRAVAGAEPVVLVAPYHPMTVRDATDLQQAGHYAFWLERQETRSRLRGFADALERHPPPVIAQDPWPGHTDGHDLIAWLSRETILGDGDAQRLRRLVDEKYEKVCFPLLAGNDVPPFGSRFWVRNDRLAAKPPPRPSIASCS